MNQLFFTTILFLGTVFSSIAQNFNGYALFNHMNSNTTYLIDKNGNIAHSWNLPTECNYSVRLKPNGNIVRGAIKDDNIIWGAAVGGKIQEFTPNGTLVWEYEYSNANHVSHHDFCLLPNGNIILTAWEVRTQAQLIQAGRQNVTIDKWPCHFVELQPTGNTATIVWEWHFWDHLIQDYDPSKSNYGVVADHPELFDINAIDDSGPFSWGEDWFHTNGIAFNEEKNQLVFSSRLANEIFVIDHSTTTAEAASHTGGNSGKGGDFLYRWGNPANYNGTGIQNIPDAVHDPHWIKNDGRLNGGYIQFMNNSGANGFNSAIDAIDAPENGYLFTLSSGPTYAPSSFTYRHNCLISSGGQGASDIMSNGNIFVNVSGGYMYEVNQAGTVVWQYAEGPAKAFRYECDHPGIIALLGTDPCDLASLSETALESLAIYPNPSSGEFKLDGLELGPNKMEITVTNAFGEIVLQTADVLEFDLSHCARGLYIVALKFNGEKTIHRKITVK